ncbi:MAG: formylglycine-generating enzyme family protein [Chitinophagaceae bacterium]|nr:MAG: formylglycine-generating enzyme family protein [Chitinophagaceae bacterium]
MQSLSAQIKPTEFKPYEQFIQGTAVKFNLVPIPAGSFLMGSAPAEKGRKEDEGPQQKVSLAAFWMGTHEVTYDEFLTFFDDEKTSRNVDVDAVTRPTAQYIDLSWGMGKQGGFPVNSMSHHTAMMYCHWLYQKTGVFYRLPTEAEWEYACRAGSTTAYYFGDDASKLGDYAWFAANSKKKYQKVGQKKPNAWGLYDMLGNVSEWTLDQYTPEYYQQVAAKTTDPVIAPATKYSKSVRGGGYLDEAGTLRIANRNKSEPSWNKRDPQIPKSKWWLTDGMSVGFRVVSPLEQPTPAEAEAFYKQYISL